MSVYVVSLMQIHKMCVYVYFAYISYESFLFLIFIKFIYFISVDGILANVMKKYTILGSGSGPLISALGRQR